MVIIGEAFVSGSATNGSGGQVFAERGAPATDDLISDRR